MIPAAARRGELQREALLQQRNVERMHAGFRAFLMEESACPLSARRDVHTTECTGDIARTTDGHYQELVG